MKSWTVICGSRRDQEEGGGAGPSQRVGQSFASPGEIKGGDAGPSRKPRRDQEEGGGAGPSQRVGQSFASPGEIKGGDAGPSRKPRRDEEQGGGVGPSLRVGQSLASVVAQQLLLRSCDCAAQLLKQLSAKYASCFARVGSPLPYHCCSAGG